jgi:hypothetical protein
MTYDNMEVGNGTEAIQAWDKLVLDEATSEPEKQTIKQSLLSYCKQDTLAMVEIFLVVRGNIL